MPKFTMNSCELRHEITIQQLTTTQDSTGQAVESFADFLTTRARIRPLTGRERFVAQSVQPDATTEFTIRYFAGITEKMRIVFEGTNYNILSIDDVPDMRHAWLQITCGSGLNDG